MHVSPVNIASSVAPASGAAAQRSPGGGEGGFGNVMSKLLEGVNSPQLEANSVVEKFATGETESVNDVVLSVAKADISFRLFMEIRNRLISSYQEIQRMQV